MNPLHRSLLALPLVLLTASPSTGADAPTSKPDVTLSIFGIGASAQRAQNLDPWMPQFQAIGVQSLRACRTDLGAVEPAEGQWSWTVLDKQLDYAQANHMEFFAMLHGKGKWNHKDPDGGLPMHSIDVWSTYVTELVKHTKGKIKYFEVWNEPPNGTKNAPPEDYAKVVIAAYDAAKAVDPNCMIGIAAKSADLNYISRAIQAGAKDHFDYVTVHPYETLDTIIDHPGLEGCFMGIVPAVHKMLSEIDPVKADVPVIFTEIGCDAKRKGPEIQAQALLKSYTMGLAQGVACINWFEGMDGDSGPMGLMMANGEKRPAFTAYETLIQNLGTYPKYLGWVMVNDKDYGFVFQGAKNPVLITWAPKDITDKIDLGQPSIIIDPLTGNSSTASTYDLTTSPIIVNNPAPALVTQAQANKAKPFSWGGDYTDAKSVSLTIGDKTETKGLHTLSGDSIAASVVAYGGNARAGDAVPGGTVFLVDPNFLTYSSTPIEIKVVCRRDTSNTAAELHLEYESTSGFKKLPVVPIPDNTDWFTQTWQIDDAQFVGMYAYNFRLDPGKFLIQSVTVTKK